MRDHVDGQPSVCNFAILAACKAQPNRGGEGMLRTFVLLFYLCVLVPSSFAEIGTPNDSRLKAVTDRKVVRIAYRSDATPFSFLRERDKPVGYTIDLCRLVVDAVGRQLDQSLNIEWVPVTVYTRFSAIAKNQADMNADRVRSPCGVLKRWTSRALSSWNLPQSSSNDNPTFARFLK